MDDDLFLDVLGDKDVALGSVITELDALAASDFHPRVAGGGAGTAGHIGGHHPPRGGLEVLSCVL